MNFEGVRPGSQPDPQPPTESGQESPEPVRIIEVRVNQMRELYGTSDSRVLNPGLHSPGRDLNREGQAPIISSPRRDLHSFPARPQTGHA